MPFIIWIAVAISTSTLLPLRDMRELFANFVPKVVADVPVDAELDLVAGLERLAKGSAVDDAINVSEGCQLPLQALVARRYFEAGHRVCSRQRKCDRLRCRSTA